MLTFCAKITVVIIAAPIAYRFKILGTYFVNQHQSTKTILICLMGNEAIYSIHQIGQVHMKLLEGKRNCWRVRLENFRLEL